MPAVPPPRILVTGAGIVSPLGLGWQEHEASFRAHRAPFRPVTMFDVSQRIARTAASVDLPEERLFLKTPLRRQHLIDRGTRMLMLALRECLAMGGLPGMEGVDAIVIGTSAGAMGVGQEYFRRAAAGSTRQPGQLSRLEFYQPHRQMNALAAEYGWHGPILIVSNACASGANAIGDAMAMIQTGRARRVLAGGYDALAELVYTGFDTLRALAPSGIPRPFDAARDGLALGEGAAMVLLESAEAARERNATAVAWAAGYATATDLHHLTQPDPEGKAAIRTMTQACQMAGLQPGQIHYINSHGTGTPYNDVAEASAIRAWAGEAAANIALSSTKSAMGHLLGGAGAVEAVICLMALRGQWLPASLHVREADPAVCFDLVREFRQAPLRSALTNSFGFGGTNATLVFSLDEPAPGTPKFHPAGPLHICGAGAVSPAGWGVPALVEAVMQPNAPPLPCVDVVRSIGVRDWPCPARTTPPPPPDRVPKFARLRRASAITKFSISAALEALGGHTPERGRLGIIQVVFNGCVQFSGKFYHEVLATPALASPLIFPETVYNAPASHIAAFLGADGPVTTLIGDSSAIAEGITMAGIWLEQGWVDQVLLIGAEETDWLGAEAVSYYHPDLPAGEGAGALLLSLAPAAGSDTPALRVEPPRARPFHNESERAAVLKDILKAAPPGAQLVTGLSGVAALDAAEAGAIASMATAPVAVSMPRKILGESMGAAGAFELVLAAALAKEGRTPVHVTLPGALAAAYGVVIRQD